MAALLMVKRAEYENNALVSVGGLGTKIE
jgi:hypothetical protein